MKPRNLLLAVALATCGAIVLAPSTVRAQSTTTGAIQGVVTDKKTSEKLAGVTVVVTSPALSQTQNVITDENGFYKVTDLPPGVYLVTFFYADIQIQKTGVNVGVNKVTPVFQEIDQGQAGGEVVKIEAKAPTIDPTSTTQGITIDKNYLKNIPVPGRTFEAALGAAAGSQNDGVGVSFSGSSSLENQYYVDGVNTTGLTLGTVGSPVINDFIEEIEVITGGYNAEFGRATGGIVNVVTKSGSNEVKGSVFGYWHPGQLTASTQLAPINATSIDFKRDINYDADFGFEVGGPIIKDKLWYFVGFAPAFQRYDWTRITKSRTDCRKPVGPGITQGSIPGLSNCDPGMYGDGRWDVDPRTGFYITDTIDSEIRAETSHAYNILSKINYAVTPEHQGQISFQALPQYAEVPGLNGPAQNGIKEDKLTTDISAKWTSKFNDNKTEVEAIVGWHRDEDNTNPLAQMYFNQPAQSLLGGDLHTWGSGDWGSGTHAESDKTLAGCFDGVPGGNQDKYPLITNCPMDTRNYVVGGIGGINRDIEQRRAITLSVTERAKFWGSHEIKGGIDVESNLRDKARLLSGGEIIQNDVGSDVQIQRYVALGGVSNMFTTNPEPGYYNQTCSNGAGRSGTAYYCAYLSGTPGARGTQIIGNTLNLASYLRDSWQILPNLTLNLGLRYEEQRLRYAKFLQGQVDPNTNEKRGEDAMDLTGMLAPRIGIIYDPTKEGRAKIYGHWGRFYESIPMDINDRAFGGEVFDEQIWTTLKSCGAKDNRIGGPNGVNCPTPNPDGSIPKPDQEQLLGSGGELIQPGIQAQYMDEIIAGLEYEVLDDLKIGVSFQNRHLGRIIEDVSVDGANTYIIANPGEWSTQAESDFKNKIAMTDDPTTKMKLMDDLKQFQGIRQFDHARRDYNALQFTLTRRFSKKLYVQASYTYSRNEGNYPGLVSYENGQLDPNISSQFDLIELLANHIGPFQTDRPHYIKVDGYYTFDLKKQGTLTVGIRLRALSGIPENALASHWLYGPNESYLLPRGSLGRTDFEHGLDTHIGYARDIGHGMNLELFFDIYNIYDRQGTFYVDDTYALPYSLACVPGPGVTCSGAAGGTLQNANPVAGGSYEDLIWVKSLDQKGTETNIPIGRNPNFHHTTTRYDPAYGRLGVRLTF
jgi:hypothetical protein